MRLYFVSLLLIVLLQDADGNPLDDAIKTEHGLCFKHTDGRFICVCDGGWSGELCSFPAPESCLPDACGAHGECELIEGRSKCVCHEGWEGATCELPKVVHPVEVDWPTDSCPTGFTGDDCTEDIDECEYTGMCPAGWTCVNRPGTFECTCSSEACSGSSSAPPSSTARSADASTAPSVDTVTHDSSTSPGEPIHDPSDDSTSPIIPIIAVALGLLALVVLVCIAVKVFGAKKQFLDAESGLSSSPPFHHDRTATLLNLTESPTRRQSRLNDLDTYLHRQAIGAEGPVVLKDPSDSWMVRAQDANGCTPLHCLALSTNDQKSAHQIGLDFDVLDACGADVNEKDNDGSSALHLAIRNSKLSLARRLLDCPRTDLCIENKQGMTPLELAVQQGDEVIVRLLLDKDAVKRDVNHCDHAHHTALVLALVHWPAATALVRHILDAGADPNYHGDEKYRRSPLHYATEAGEMAIPSMELLLSHGANINKRDMFGKTVLHHAVRNWDMKTVQFLAENGASKDSTDKTNITPYQLAVQIAFMEACQYFTSPALTTLKKEKARMSWRNTGNCSSRDRGQIKDDRIFEDDPEYSLEDLEGARYDYVAVPIDTTPRHRYDVPYNSLRSSLQPSPPTIPPPRPPIE